MEEKRRKSASLKRFGRGAAVFVVIMAVLAGISQIQKSCSEPGVLKPFKPYLKEYTDIPGLTSAPPEEEPYIAGKAITVDIGEKKLDSIYLELPADMAAATPEEVGTIIWLKWENVYVGKYVPGGGSAYKITCEVTLIDKQKAVIIGEKTFTGSDPPVAKSGGGDGYGSKPTEEIVDYLKSLLRR